MKITIESTDKVVTLATETGDVPARLWQGTTADGIPVVCFITRICPAVTEDDPRFSQVVEAFDRELQSCAQPVTSVEGFDMRLII